MIYTDDSDDSDDTWYDLEYVFISLYTSLYIRLINGMSSLSILAIIRIRSSMMTLSY